jgi:hypothetical protein
LNRWVLRVEIRCAKNYVGSLFVHKNGLAVEIKETIEKWMKSPQNVSRLVLGCVDSYDSNRIVILQHFSRSIRFSYFCTAQPSKFQQNIVKFLPEWKKSFVSRFFDEFCNFLQRFDEILPEFHRNIQEMTKCLDILRKSAIKVRKMLEIFWICGKFHFSVHFFNRLPTE